MTIENIFVGNSIRTIFAQHAYFLLMERIWVNHRMIMAKYWKCDEKSISKIASCKGYGELKKAVLDVKRAIEEEIGADCFEEEGNNRNKRFRYIGKNDSPLAEMINSKIKYDIQHYVKFCQDSSDFFPYSWLEHFFKDSLDLLNIKQKKQRGEQIISTSIDRQLVNIEYLPSIYEAIIGKYVLDIDYKPLYGEQITVVFHPHYLKEYNGRWFVLGHTNGYEPEYGYTLSLDRMQSTPRKNIKIKYVNAPSKYYEKYFKDIVGVSYIKNTDVEEIVIRAHTYYIYKLTETKPIHNSQKIKTYFGEYNDGTYGEFSIRIKPNNEFIGRILQMGEGLEIVSPQNVRCIFTSRIKQMYDLYHRND